MHGRVHVSVAIAVDRFLFLGFEGSKMTGLMDLERRTLGVGGLQILFGLVGLAWGIGQGDPLTIGLWAVYLLIGAAYLWANVRRA